MTIHLRKCYNFKKCAHLGNVPSIMEVLKEVTQPMDKLG